MPITPFKTISVNSSNFYRISVLNDWKDNRDDPCVLSIMDLPDILPKLPRGKYLVRQYGYGIRTLVGIYQYGVFYKGMW